MRKYWIDAYTNFDNIYNVIYTETVQQENKAFYNGYERITRKDAMRLCSKRANGQLKPITNI